MKQKLISILIVFILLQQFCCFVFAENLVNEEINNEVNNEVSLEEQKGQVTDKIDQTNKKLEYVQNELSSTMLQVQKLEDQVLKYQNEIDNLGNQLTSLENSINYAKEKLTTVTEEYNQKDQILKDRIVALYEDGDTTYLDILLSSRNIVEFISGYYIISELIDYDNQLLREVEEKKDNIEIKKAKLEKEEEQLRLLKAKREQTTIVLQNTITLQNSYSLKLSKEEKELQKQLTEYKIQEIKLDLLMREAANTNIDLSIQYTGGPMIWPVAIKGTCITSGYGVREHPIQGIIKEHTGIDIGNADYGSPVVAAADGIVSYAGWISGYGNCVIINHGNGVATLYGHGQKILTELHKEVKQGELIMEVGSTGNSTGPHLHFEVRINGEFANPLNFVKAP